MSRGSRPDLFVETAQTAMRSVDLLIDAGEPHVEILPPAVSA